MCVCVRTTEGHLSPYAQWKASCNCFIEARAKADSDFYLFIHLIVTFILRFPHPLTSKNDADNTFWSVCAFPPSVSTEQVPWESGRSQGSRGTRNRLCQCYLAPWWQTVQCDSTRIFFDKYVSIYLNFFAPSPFPLARWMKWLCFAWTTVQWWRLGLKTRRYQRMAWSPLWAILPQARRVKWKKLVQVQ